MKSTGMVRKVDVLGRIVIPKEIRDTNGVEIGDELEIFIDGDQIILKKHEPNCLFCKDSKNLKHYKNKLICSKCIIYINNQI